jgi:hypothetical protein
MTSPSENAPPAPDGRAHTNEARGRLTLGGRVVLEDVTVYLRPPGGRGAWDGYLVVPAGRSIPTEGTFRLTFPDGRQGYVELLTRHFNAHAETPILFRLAGPQGR